MEKFWGNITNLKRSVFFSNLLILLIFLFFGYNSFKNLKEDNLKNLKVNQKYFLSLFDITSTRFINDLYFISYLYTINDYFLFKEDKQVETRFLNKLSEIHKAYDYISSLSLIKNNKVIFSQDSSKIYDTLLLNEAIIKRKIIISNAKIYDDGIIIDGYVPVYDKKIKNKIIGVLKISSDLKKIFVSFNLHFKDTDIFHNLVFVYPDSFIFFEPCKNIFEVHKNYEIKNLFSTVNNPEIFEISIKKDKYLANVKKISTFGDNLYLLILLNQKVLNSKITSILFYTLLLYLLTISIVNLLIFFIYLFYKNEIYKKEIESKNEIVRNKIYLETLLDSSPLMIFDISKELKINFFVNRTAKTFFGLDKNNLNFQEILNKNDYSILKKSIEEFYLKEDKSFDNFEIVYDNYSEKRFLNFYLSPLKIDNIINSVIVIVSDITDIKNYEKSLEEKNRQLFFTLQQLETANEELQTSEEELLSTEEELKIQVEELERKTDQLHEMEERYKIALKNSSISIFFQDVDLKFKYAFNLPENIDPKNIYDKTDDDIFKGNEVKRFMDLKRESILSGKSFSGQIELIFYKRDYIFLYNIEPSISKDGKRVGILSTLQDITEKMELQKELIQAFKLETLGNLAGGIAHDFNNILAGIMGNAEILQMKIDDEELLKFVSNIIKISEHASNLTKKLLHFSRKGKYMDVEFSVHKTITDVCNIFERTVDKKIKIEQHLTAKPATIKGDPSLIETAILNLLINSRDAIMEKGTGGNIKIFTQNFFVDKDFSEISNFKFEEGNYINIKISDDGIGMDDETKRHIFEPFFTTKEIGKGTGLGLASVYGAIKSHKGYIDFYSEKFKGTTFNIYLPLVDENIETDFEENLAKTKSLEISKGILVIDDEEQIRTSCKEFFESKKLKVFTAKDGNEGVEIFKTNKEKISIIILDLIMPNISGEETFYFLRKIDKKIPIIVCSGYSEDSRVREILSLDNVLFIQKPFKFNLLIDKINEFLGKLKKE